MPTAAEGRARMRADRRHFRRQYPHGRASRPTISSLSGRPGPAVEVRSHGTYVPPVPVTLGRTGRTIFTSPALAQLLRPNIGVGESVSAAHYEHHQRRVLGALLQNPKRGPIESQLAADLLREYHPKRYRDLVASYVLSNPQEATGGAINKYDVAAAANRGQLATAEQRRHFLYGVEQSTRARQINALADAGIIEHPNAPHGLSKFISDVIPDTPLEIAIVAGTAGLGAPVAGTGAKGIETIGGQLAYGARGARAALATRAGQGLSALADTAGGQALRQAGRISASAIKHRRELTRGLEAVSRAPAAVRQGAALAGQGARRAAAAGAERFPLAAQGLRYGARGTGYATLPARRAAGIAARNPIKVFGAGPVALQVPAASQSQNPIGELAKGLEGTGVAAASANSIASAVAQAAPGEIAQNLVADAFNLPAQALPSVYLPVAAAVELAAKGDDTRANQLLSEYGKTGIIPALLRGDPKAALDSLKQHPLFGALEASGAYAVAGRGLGAVARNVTRGEVGGLARPPLQIYGDVQVPRRYSPNIFTKGFQRAGEERMRRQGLDPNRATAQQAQAYLKGTKQSRLLGRELPVIEGHRRTPTGAVNRFMSLREELRRRQRDLALRRRDAMRPRRHADVVSLVVQNVVRTPKTWKEDLRAYRTKLEQARDSGDLSRSELAANRATLKAIDKAIDASPKDIEAVFRSADSYVADHAPVEQGLIGKGLLDVGQVERAKLFPYAIQHMGARYQSKGDISAMLKELDAQRKAVEESDLPGHQKAAQLDVLDAEAERLAMANAKLVDANGGDLSNEAIRAHMKQNGVPEPGFLTHRPGFRRKGNFFQPFETGRGRIPQRGRTGRALETGAFDASYAALREQHAYSHTVLSRVESHDELISRFGITKPGGGVWRTYGEAQRAAMDPVDAGLKIPPEVGELQPVRIAPLHALQRELDSARLGLTEKNRAGQINPLEEAAQRRAEFDLSPDYATSLEGHFQHALEQAMQPGKGPVVLVPKMVLDQVRAHNLRAGAVAQGFQALTNTFKSAVLPTSVKWFMGNMAELTLRSGFNGLGPSDYVLGRKLLAAAKRHDAEHGTNLAERMESSIVSGTNYASVEQTKLYRDVEESSSSLWGRFKQAPGPRNLLGMYARYAHNVFRLNGFLERQPQFAALGKEARRQVQETRGYWNHAIMVGGKGMADLIQGLHHTDNQIRYAHAIEDVFGRWGKNSPEARYLLTTYAPFYMWARAATRFVLLTLPVKHPIKTGLIAAAAEMTDAERERLGLDILSKQRVPSFLQGAIPTGGGKLAPAQYYSSFGVFADYPQTLSNFVLPQLNFIPAFAGLSWTGDHLAHADGTPTNQLENVALGAYLQAEAMLPFLSQARRVLEGGGSSVDTSTVFNPQVTKGTSDDRSLLKGLERVFSPVHEYPKGTVDYLRSLPSSREITVPVSGSSGGGSSSGGGAAWWNSGSSGSSGSSGTKPWWK